MAATEDDSTIIELEEEVEGDRQCSEDYCFVEVGEPVPLNSGDDYEFDLKSPPLQPLAVSERFGLVFVAHSTGFCVARTKDLIESAKVIKKEGSGSSIKELCVVDVAIGKVYILALSADSSTLAASIGGNIHFFSVSSLLSKEENPSFSYSLNDSSCVKDMQWTKKLQNYYVVLSNNGKLYYGARQDPLKHIMDNVDAVEWSVKGGFVAVARKNILSILSSKFKQKFSMSLSFKSWIGDSDVNCIIKVDSIRWVRRDCIIVGCFQLTVDGTEENYLVQVITSNDGKITDAFSKPIVLSFSDVFEGFIDDILPFGSGPYMSLTYLESCELAIISNRKSTDPHIVFFGWSLDGEKKEAAVIDILRDTLVPKISLQGNGDENTVLGLCVDKVSFNENVGVTLGADYKELSPFCLLLCLSLDGKLFMFQVASATGASVPSDILSPFSDKEDDTPIAVSSEDGLSKSSVQAVKSVEQLDLGFQSQEVNTNELSTDGGSEIAVNSKPIPFTDEMTLKETITGRVTTPADSPAFRTTGLQQKFPVSELNQVTDGQQSILSGQQSSDFEQSTLAIDVSTKKLHEYRSGPDSSSKVAFADVSSKKIPSTLPKVADLGKEIPKNLGSEGLKGASSMSSSNGKLIFPAPSVGGSSPFSSWSVQSNQSDSSGTSLSVAQLPGRSIGNSSSVKEAGGQPTASRSSEKTAHSGGHSPSTWAGFTKPSPSIGSSPLSYQQNSTLVNSSKDKFRPNKESSRTAAQSRLLTSEPHLSKQFGNVEEMIKELDTLLECIEGAGGFVDACTVVQKSSVLALEEGIGIHFDRCKLFKNIMDHRLREIQSLLDNTVQVLARKIYMEGIVKQATDGHYWDLWNHQKLSSELELKRRGILQVNQELTNQLIELESHLNTLELNKFGEKGGVQVNKKTFPGRYGPSRHVQSLHSLRNAMTSQLAAAEQLSDCLSKQMSVLSIERPSAKKQNVRRELFEAIGIPYDGASFSSPDEKKDSDTPSNNKLFTSCTDALKVQSRRSQSSAVRGSESEITRRRRDSLDQSWANFEPPKTTVKRFLLHEDRPKASIERLPFLLDDKHMKSHMQEGSPVALPGYCTTTSTLFYPSEDKGIQDRPAKQASGFTSTSHGWFHDSSGPLQSTSGLKSLATQILSVNSFSVSSPQPAAISSTIDHKNGARSHSNLSGNVSSSLKVNVSDSSHKSDADLHQAPSTSKRLSGQTLSLPNSNGKVTNLVKSTLGSGKHSPSVAENNSFSSGKGPESPFSPASAVGPAPNLNAEPFQSGTIASLSTSIPSSPAFLQSSLVPPSLNNPAARTPSSVSIGRLSTGFDANTDVSQSLAQSLVSSSPILSSASSCQIPEIPLPSPAPIHSLNLKTESPTKEPQPSTAKLSSKMDKNSTIQASTPNPKPASVLKLDSSVPSTPTSGPSSDLQSESEPSFNRVAIPAANVAFSNPEKLFSTDVPSAALVLSTSASVNSGKDEISDAVTLEDEMEEEAPEISETSGLTLGSLSGFGIGLSPGTTAAKPNPFGMTFANAAPTPASFAFNTAIPTGELFRPASFSFQSPQPSQSPQVPSFGALSGSSLGTPPQTPAGSGFGQPAQVGSGQQALGSVLGAFGQSRQLGAILPGTSPSSASGFSGGLVSSPSTGGFSGIASSGGGFASLASAGGGFAGVASAGGGFAAAASAPGGFSQAASGGGGFAQAASGGFGQAASGGGFLGSGGGGGFGTFNSQLGSGGFSSFGGTAGGAARPPAEFLMKMRK